MAKIRTKRWARDRRWLKKAPMEAKNAADWSPEKAAEVEDRLRRILLRTLAAPETDRTSLFVGHEAIDVLIALEAVKQDRELAALEAARRSAVVVTINL